MEPIYSTNIIYNEYPEPITEPPYTGSYDTEFLQTLNYSENDITELNKTVTWDEEDNPLYLLTDLEKENILTADTDYYYNNKQRTTTLKFIPNTHKVRRSRFFSGERYSANTLYSSLIGFSENLDWSSWNPPQNFFQLFKSNSSLRYAPIPNIVQPNNMQDMFNSCFNLKKVTPFNMSNVTNITNAFYNCHNLEELPDLNFVSPLNCVNTFYYCTKLKEVNMPNCLSLTNPTNMFRDCCSLKKVNSKDDKLTIITGAQSCFYNCRNLIEVPHIALANGGLNLDSMFYNCHSLKEVSMSSHTISRSTRMFQNCYSLEKHSPLTLNQGESNATYMFNNCHSLKESHITLMNMGENFQTFSLYYYCYSLKKVTLHVGPYQSVRNMFAECPNLEEVILTARETSVDSTSTVTGQGLYSLKKITGVQYLLDYTSTGDCNTWLQELPVLEEIRLKNIGQTNVKHIINIYKTPVLSKESILFMIENSKANALEIQIKLHATVKAMADADADIQAALALKPNITITT